MQLRVLTTTPSIEPVYAQQPPIDEYDAQYIKVRASGKEFITGFGASRRFGREASNFDCNLLHANFRSAAAQQPANFRLQIGARRQTVRPMEIISPINIAPMSVGGINISTAAILGRAAAGRCFINTGEGGLGPQADAGADTIVQIGTGKIGVGRKIDQGGKIVPVLDENRLVAVLDKRPSIRAIQIKISQGAKPGAVFLPGAKISEEVAAIRGISANQPSYSPVSHSEIEAASPEESMRKLMLFIRRIREITGLPVGIKISMGHPIEFRQLVHTMACMDECPDMITLDGADGGTAAAQSLVANYVGYGSVYHALYYLDYMLRSCNLRDKIHVSASGKLYTPIRALVAYALGAQTVETGRGLLLAIGCTQCMGCHTGDCPVSITSRREPERSVDIQHDLVQRAINYIQGFNADLQQLAEIAGTSSPLAVTKSNFEGDLFRHIESDLEKYLE